MSEAKELTAGIETAIGEYIFMDCSAPSDEHTSCPATRSNTR